MRAPVLLMVALTAFAQSFDSATIRPRRSNPDRLPTPSNPAPFASKGLFLPGALALQLGLHLESRKLPVEVLSIDHAVRIPTEK